ncbi:MAG: YraN family protein [bacterium]|nr:YraN family protein [Chitinophagaceae bacterium]
MGDNTNRSRKIIGAKGEELAADWLKMQGFDILHRNWRTGRFETDIIATREGRLHFIEVKTRRSDRYGLPERQVDRKKLDRMIDAGSEYIRRHPQWRWIRFDIIAVRLYENAPAQIDHIEDLY